MTENEPKNSDIAKEKISNIYIYIYIHKNLYQTNIVDLSIKHSTKDMISNIKCNVTWIRGISSFRTLSTKQTTAEEINCFILEK